jgi:hypothetical protein
MKPTKPIRLFRDEYAFLSNFYPATVEYEGLRYPTVENAYQAAKTDDPKVRKQFVNLTPLQAKRAGAQLPRKSNWFDISLQLMASLVLQKFQSHPDLKLALLDTGDAPLVEGNDWHDTFWGVCDCRKHGYGDNHLGKILMKVREVLKGNNK